MGKVALVTGGATGIGAACVRRFAAEGWDVAIGYFLEQERSLTERLAQEAEEAGVAAVVLQADVTRDEDCRRLAAATDERFGRLDALVCSAGASRIVPHANLDGLALDDFLKLTAVNTAGPFHAVRACASALAADEGGAVVIVSSYGAVYGTGSSMAYAASKGAANTLTMSLARVLAPKVRVNAVCPALTADGFLQRLDAQLYEQRAARQIARAPLAKVARPEEVAADIFWLAAGTRLITGAVVSLDCGLHLNGDG